MNGQRSLIEMVTELIFSKREDDWWDFKEFHYEDKGSMLHDIICLANNRANRDSYLILGVRDKTFEIVGVENDPNRKNQQNIVDFLRTPNFAGHVRPRVEVQTIAIAGHEIDVFIVKNSNDVPYYLIEDYIDKKYKSKSGKDGKKVMASHIYTRVMDNNTPVDKTADIRDVEYLWKKRFGLSRPPIERFQALLADKQEWDVNEEDIRYYKYAPEYTIVEERDEDRNGYEFYLFNQTNNNPHWYNVKLYYHSTLLYTVDAVSLDGGRCFTSTAQTEFLNLKMHDDVSYKSFIKGTLRYAVHNFYITSDGEYSEETYARNRYLECVLIFESQEEKESFNRFAREKYNTYRNDNIERIQKLLHHFGEIKGYNMSVFKRQYEEALLLKELLNVFRGEE